MELMIWRMHFFPLLIIVFFSREEGENVTSLASLHIGIIMFGEVEMVHVLSRSFLVHGLTCNSKA